MNKGLENTKLVESVERAQRINEPRSRIGVLSNGKTCRTYKILVYWGRTTISQFSDSTSDVHTTNANVATTKFCEDGFYSKTTAPLRSSPTPFSQEIIGYISSCDVEVFIVLDAFRFRTCISIDVVGVINDASTLNMHWR